MLRRTRASHGGRCAHAATRTKYAATIRIVHAGVANRPAGAAPLKALHLATALRACIARTPLRGTIVLRAGTPRDATALTGLNLTTIGCTRTRYSILVALGWRPAHAECARAAVGARRGRGARWRCIGTFAWLRALARQAPGVGKFDASAGSITPTAGKRRRTHPAAHTRQGRANYRWGGIGAAIARHAGVVRRVGVWHVGVGWYDRIQPRVARRSLAEIVDTRVVGRRTRPSADRCTAGLIEYAAAGAVLHTDVGNAHQRVADAGLVASAASRIECAATCRGSGCAGDETKGEYDRDEGKQTHAQV